MRPSLHSVRVFLISRRWLTAGACLCLAVLMFCLVSYPSAVNASAASRMKGEWKPPRTLSGTARPPAAFTAAENSSIDAAFPATATWPGQL